MPAEGQLATLNSRLLRSARALLDPELQSGKTTPDAARIGPFFVAPPAQDGDSRRCGVQERRPKAGRPGLRFVLTTSVGKKKQTP